ncbi:FAD-dependent oxidoreductase [Arthrobacter sp. JSM 101049]|uniref:FAD-dependent oxidoreductase n=1 Tax=Arthrobacter sp. JSM 101049 TaxID=929097 RepID=UPI0035628E5C
MIDVLIAGGGPSGLALATLLAQSGMTVRVLEPRPSPSTHSRAIGLHPPALEVLDAVGVGTAAVAAGVPIRRGIGLAGLDTVASMDFGVLSGPHPYVLSLPQSHTVRLLQERLSAVDPDALLRGTAVDSFAPLDDGVRVSLTENTRGPGGQLDGPRASKTLSARYLVGADGVDSTVRRQLGLPFIGRRYGDHYVMGDYPDGTGFGSTAALILHREGIVESFPLPGRLRRWVAWRRPDETADLSALVLGRTGHHAAAADATMNSDFRCSRRSVPRMAADRVVLIGDAAHEVSPIGGQGMALGLLDAAALAPLLGEAIAGAWSAGATAERFSAFSDRRLRAAARAGRQAHLNMMLGRPLARRPDGLRRTVLAGLARHSVVHDAVARRFTMSHGF